MANQTQPQKGRLKMYTLFTLFLSFVVYKLAWLATNNLCNVCGKPITRNGTINAGMGARCKHLQAQGYTGTTRQKSYAKVTINTIPPGYVKVGKLHNIVKANQHKYVGLSINRMVNCFGKDTPNGAPIHPICQPYYLPNRHRVVHGWLATQAGLKAMATLNFSGAPKFTPPNKTK